MLWLCGQRGSLPSVLQHLRYAHIQKFEHKMFSYNRYVVVVLHWFPFPALHFLPSELQFSKKLPTEISMQGPYAVCHDDYPFNSLAPSLPVSCCHGASAFLWYSALAPFTSALYWLPGSVAVQREIKGRRMYHRSLKLIISPNTISRTVQKETKCCSSDSADGVLTATLTGKGQSK